MSYWFKNSEYSCEAFFLLYITVISRKGIKIYAENIQDEHGNMFEQKKKGGEDNSKCLWITWCLHMCLLLVLLFCHFVTTAFAHCINTLLDRGLNWLSHNLLLFFWSCAALLTWLHYAFPRKLMLSHLLIFHYNQKIQYRLLSQSDLMKKTPKQKNPVYIC